MGGVWAGGCSHQLVVLLVQSDHRRGRLALVQSRKHGTAQLAAAAGVARIGVGGITLGKSERGREEKRREEKGERRAEERGESRGGGGEGECRAEESPRRKERAPHLGELQREVVGEGVGIGPDRQEVVGLLDRREAAPRHPHRAGAVEELRGRRRVSACSCSTDSLVECK